ncbi:MAG TPA: hypothetical protein DCM01_07555 [Dielma fastidiosa]|jgi:DNA-directed RNA polymerase specialized sigma24 family protein|nr:hypothetical protein [Dielma fastidiosa]
MLTEKDKIEQFKRDLRSYTYHQKKAMEIDEKLEELAVKMQGVSSPSTKEIILENAGNPYGERKLELLMEEGELVKERNKHLTEIQRIDEVLKLLPIEYREMLIEIYVNRCHMDDIANRIPVSRSKLKRDINQMIRNIIIK